MNTVQGELFEHAEKAVWRGVEWLRLLVETLGALVVAVGVVVLVIGLARHYAARRDDSFIPVRLAFARYLTLALELQLASDILATAVAPTWDRIGQLAAIAVIRTVLNHFLSREMKDEARERDHERERERKAGAAIRPPDPVGTARQRAATGDRPESAP